jgi:hypothetical protein
MAKTWQISVTSGSPTAISVKSTTCKIVRVMENRGVVGWPNTDLLIMKPTSADTPVRIPPGSYPFQKSQGPYQAGEVAGYVQTVVGTTTLDVDEDSP